MFVALRLRAGTPMWRAGFLEAWMRNTLVAAAALLVATASTAFADGKQDFDLVNRTGYTIDKVFVSPSNSNDWEDDVLGRDVLDDGEKVHIRFSRAAKSCKWDLKVVYSDSETSEWDEFDLCEVSKITIRYNRKSGETSAIYE
jgi:hypothetical protein